MSDTKTDYDFDITTCCRVDNNDRYGSVWLTDDSLNIGPSPHTCHVAIATIKDAHKLTDRSRTVSASKTGALTRPPRDWALLETTLTSF